MKLRKTIAGILLGCLAGAASAADLTFKPSSGTDFNWSETSPLSTISAGDRLQIRCDGGVPNYNLTYDLDTATTLNGIFVGIYGDPNLRIAQGELISDANGNTPGSNGVNHIGFGTESKLGADAVSHVFLSGTGKLTLSGTTIFGYFLNNNDGSVDVDVTDSAVLTLNATTLETGTTNNTIIGTAAQTRARIFLSGNGQMNVAEAVNLLFHYNNTGTTSYTPDAGYRSYISMQTGGSVKFEHVGKNKAYYTGLVSNGTLRANGIKVPNFDDAFVFTATGDGADETAGTADDPGYVTAKAAITTGTRIALASNDIVDYVGGELNSSSDFLAGYNTDGTLNMISGSITVDNNVFYIGYKSTGAVNQTGGTLNLTNHVYIGDNSSTAVGVLNISGGVANLGGVAAKDILVGGRQGGNGKIMLSGDGQLNIQDPDGITFQNGGYVSMEWGSSAKFKSTGKELIYFKSLVENGSLRASESAVANFDSSFNYDEATGVVTVKAALELVPTADIFELVDGSVSDKNVKSNDAIPTTANAVLVTPPSYHDGSFVLNADGTFTYTMVGNPGYAADSFTYYLEDNGTTSSIAKVKLVVPEGGLVSHWKFNETTGTVASDSAPVKNDGEVTGSAVWSNGSLEFDGTTEVSMKESPQADIHALSIHFYTSESITKETPKTAFVRYGSIAQQHVLGFGDMTSYLDDETFSIVTDNGSKRTGITTAFTAGWHNIIINWNGSIYDIYLDGVKQEGGQLIHNSGGAGLISSDAFGLGKSGTYGAFSGKIDDVRIYNRALTEDEINIIYTPAIGLEVVQTGAKLSWTVGDESGVKEYQVVDTATGELIEVVVAGNGSYSVTLPEGVEAKLVVVDNSGFSQTFLPADGNIVKVVYDLKEGWNLIAMPGENADISALKDVTVGGIWAWNGSAYETTETPAACQGIWIYAPKTVQAIVTAEKSDVDISLQSGWNLVGPKENINVPEAAHAVYGWNDIYQNIAAEDGVLIQGIGYWIFTL